MNTCTKGALLALFLAAGPLVAQEEVRQEFAIVLATDEAGTIELENLGFSPFDLQEGESRVVTAGDGRSITITRREGEVVLVTDAGQEVVLPAPREQTMVWVDEAQGQTNVEVQVHHAAVGIVISSPRPLEEAAREAVRQALKSAGVDDPVEFVSPGSRAVFIGEPAGGEGGKREIRIIKEKRVIQDDGSR